MYGGSHSLKLKPKKGNQAIWATLFNLAPNEQGKDPSDILEEAMNDILSQNCTSFLPHPLSGHTSEITVPIKILKERAIPINKWGFWEYSSQLRTH